MGIAPLLRVAGAGKSPAELPAGQKVSDQAL
jgi:hypothetical protein